MAGIFLKTGGDFSALSPQKMVYYSLISASVGGTYGNYNSISAGRSTAFTPSSAGDCEGVFIGLRLAALSAVQTVTMKLQEQTAPGVWTDRATKSLTYDECVGSLTSTLTGGRVHSIWTYFEFATPYTITTDADKWRVYYISSDSSGYVIRTSTSTIDCLGVVITATTSYSSGDDIVINSGGISVAVDQSITSTTTIIGNDSNLSWKTSPAGAYTLAITNLSYGTGAGTYFGTSTNRIPYSAQATITITNLKMPLYWAGDAPYYFHMYGEIPTAIKTTVASSAGSGQANIVTSEDMSATWTAGDNVYIFRPGTMLTKTIQSVSGTTVTFTTNLGSTCYAGYAMLNSTRYEKCGIKLGGVFAMSTVSGNPYETYISGVYQGAYNLTVQFGYDRADSELLAASIAKIQPFLVEYVTGGASCYAMLPSAISSNANFIARYRGSIFRHRYSFGNGTSLQAYVISTVAVTVSDVYCSGYLNTVWIGVGNSTVSNVQVCLNSWAGSVQPYYSIKFTSTNSVHTNIRTSNAAISMSGISNTFTNLYVDNVVAGATASHGSIQFIGPVAKTTFTTCHFGDYAANGFSISNLEEIYVDAIFNNCTLDSSPYNTTYYRYLSPGSAVRFDTADQTANSHLMYTRDGITTSTGDALTDTTVHTSGTGKFAIKLTPLDSTGADLFDDWAFDIPTGNIQNKTMTVACWVKINNAAYYAGTHQLPRLTIDYDNGTTAYCQAGQTTDWQQLFVTFTPTTTYGAITVTMSGKTDATTTDRDFYVDDFTILYPSSVALDLGGLDNWADALPVTPPIAIPISAYTVSNAVWEELTSSHTTAGSTGKKLSGIKNQTIVLDGGVIA